MSIKISELPETNTIGNDDLIAIVQENSTKKIKFSNFIEQGKQITIINEQYTKEYYLDENFKTLVAQPITEGIYYNITPTTNPVKLITSYDEETYGYTTIPYGSYLVIYPVDIKSSGMIGATDRFYKYLLITRGDSADDRIHIISGISEAFKSTGFMPRQFMTNTISEVENTADRVGTVDENSTEDTYPNTKAVYDALELKQAEIDELYDQIPTATATGETINVQDSSNLPIKDFAILGNATQADTPTPDTPQDIHVVTGDNTVKVLGKNLFDGTYELGGINIANGIPNAASDRIRTPNFITVGASTTYTLSCANTGSVYILEYDKDQTYLGYTLALYHVLSGTITTTPTTKYVKWYYIAYNHTLTLEEQCQFEAGSTATAFTPYIEPQTQLLSLGNIELAKIGDYTDRIYKSGGKWYVYKAIGKVVLDETTTLTKNLNGTNSWNYTLGNVYHRNGAIVTAICNLFNGVPYDERTSSGNNICFLDNSSGRYQLTFRNTAYPDLAGMQELFGETNAVIYYVLDTPTTTEITDTTLIGQLENVLKMHTNKNVTNAWIEPSGNNAQGSLTIGYRQDIQTMFNNVSNAIISLGGNV